MYDKLLINRLGRRYAEKGEKDTFVRLGQALMPMIDTQLGKQYSSMKEYWDDMRQEVMLKIWDNRKSIKNNSPEKLHQYFYNRIRTGLNRASKKVRKDYTDEWPPTVDEKELNNKGFHIIPNA